MFRTQCLFYILEARYKSLIANLLFNCGKLTMTTIIVVVDDDQRESLSFQGYLHNTTRIYHFTKFT